MKALRILLILPLILVLFALLFASAATATYITMSTTVSAAAFDDFVSVNLSTVNKGNEAAHSVQFVISIKDKTIASDVKPSLNVNERFSYNYNAAIDSEFGKPGRYPVIIATNYQDANGYPFSALSLSFVNYKENLVSDVIGTIEQVEISKKGILKIKLKNNGNRKKELSARIIVPKELSVIDDELLIELSPKEEKTLSIGIESFSALTGSTYSIYALLEYEEDSKHYSGSAAGVVKVLDKKEVFFMPYWLIILIIILLVLLFVVLQFKGKRKGTRDDEKKQKKI